MTTTHRRSRKHILDMVSLKGPEFLGALNGLIHITGAVVTAEDRWMPKGYNHDREAKLCELNDMWLPDVVREEIERWWLAHAERANTPNWDLLSTCTFAGRKGLVLVEAKAHANELKVEGKILSEKASEQSKRNHARIGEAINGVPSKSPETATTNCQTGLPLHGSSHNSEYRQFFSTWDSSVIQEFQKDSDRS